MAEPTIQRVLTELEHPDPAVRSEAAQQAAMRQLRGAGLATALVRAAGDCSDEVRSWAAEALEMYGAPGPSDVLVLAGLLADPSDGEVAYWAATLLGRLGPIAAAATPELTAALAGSSFLPVREQAAWALSRIGPAALEAEPALDAAASAGPPRLSRLATHALESLRGMAA